LPSQRSILCKRLETAEISVIDIDATALMRTADERSTDPQKPSLMSKRSLEDSAHLKCHGRQTKTTRVEDIAYCLLGIFNVSMPLIYGEGSKAWWLQAEIMSKAEDQSIFDGRIQRLARLCLPVHPLISLTVATSMGISSRRAPTPTSYS
jgi:hypothetical protein